MKRSKVESRKTQPIMDKELEADINVRKHGRFSKIFLLLFAFGFASVISYNEWKHS